MDNGGAEGRGRTSEGRGRETEGEEGGDEENMGPFSWWRRPIITPQSDGPHGYSRGSGSGRKRARATIEMRERTTDSRSAFHIHTYILNRPHDILSLFHSSLLLSPHRSSLFYSCSILRSSNHWDILAQGIPSEHKFIPSTTLLRLITLEIFNPTNEKENRRHLPQAFSIPYRFASNILRCNRYTT